MTSIRALLIVVLTAAATACAPTPPASLTDPVQLQTPPADWTAADQPVIWNSFDEAAQLELSMPDAVKTQPKLYSLLRREGVAELRAFGRDARQALNEMGADARTPYTQTIGYLEPFETAGLFSLQGGSWSYTGGAHGNPSDIAVLWDKARQRRIAPADLFAAGADLTILDRALCDAVNAAKLERARGENASGPWDPVSLTPAQGEMWSCPRAVNMAVSLAPGTVPGKAGGLIVGIGPYVVGPYVEAGYSILIPLDAFAALLSPVWADQFAGAPDPALVQSHRAG
ncbi:DUF3298 domain-containing protein [Brevundimonas lenta]|uniref:DUF3298 domain-containing protein n=1 Tax=Brevundimonas lenta TaxID=424796 RepID=A0A7W6JFF8_9CAUL|nr:DUF3298 domain-containing protein [Brevundimonas lenta]MBB4084164.1 hypothetical protein [Brevundimonas lenta]